MFFVWTVCYPPELGPMALPNFKTVLKCRWDTDTQCIVTTSVTQLNEPEWNNTVDTDYNLHTLYNMKMDYSPLLIVLKYSGSCTCSDWVFLKECHLFIQLLFDRGKIVCGFGKEICLYTRSTLRRVLVMEVE